MHKLDFDHAPLAAIEAALVEDGYGALVPRAFEIRRAGQHGALLWTAQRLVTTDASRIDARPVGGSGHVGQEE